MHGDIIIQLGLFPSSSEIDLHRRLGCYDLEDTRGFVEATKNWLLKLHNANEKVNVYPASAFDHILGERWYAVCNRAAGLGLWVWKAFWQSPLSVAAGLNLLEKLKLLVKCGMKYRVAIK